MPLPLKKERDRHQSGSLAEEFRISQEAKFRSPTLEEKYWNDPNSQRGQIARCAYDVGGIKAEVMYSEGI